MDLKTKITAGVGVVLVLLFALSIWGNVYFLSGKGIVINEDKRVTNNQYQQQWQGQLLINQWTAQGDKIEWVEEFLPAKDLPAKLNTLHPISALYAKVIEYHTSGTNLLMIQLVYPDIFYKKKDIKINP